MGMLTGGFFVLFALAALTLGLFCALQVWLCKRKTRWLGLVLPVTHFLGVVCYVGAMCAGLMMFQEIGGSASVETDLYGVLIRETEVTVYEEEGIWYEIKTIREYDEDGKSFEEFEEWTTLSEEESYTFQEQSEVLDSTMTTLGLIALFGNLPTVIYGVIYLSFAQKNKQEKDLNRMMAFDLE